MKLGRVRIWVDRIADRFTDVYRPWRDDGLPEELAFGHVELWGFTRGSMGRSARLAVSDNVDYGLFGVIGLEYAHRAAWAWWPKARLLMEDVSCAFEPISDRANRAAFVPPIHIRRLVFCLNRYLAHIGKPWDTARLHDAATAYIQECRDDHAQRVAERIEGDTVQ